MNRVRLDEPSEITSDLQLTIDEPRLDPDDVQLPTIDRHPANGHQRQLLRMLAHGMSQAGLSCAMPEDLTSQSWEILEAWLRPLQAEREKVGEVLQEVVLVALNSRLEAGLYEVREVPPRTWEGMYIKWRHTSDHHGNSVLHVVRIPHGTLPEADYLRHRAQLIDRDMAMVARSFFDRFS